LAPTIEIGGVFPPKGIQVFVPTEIPLLNTLILVVSGATFTRAHHGVVSGFRKEGLNGLIKTIILGLTFTLFQAYEYKEANFTLSDGIYGSCFYVLTGFHGLHVIVGTTIIIVGLLRQLFYHFTMEHHFGLVFGGVY